MGKQLVATLTGANGFIGSHLADYLLLKGFEVRCIVRKTSDIQWLKDKPLKLYDCGLGDVAALKAPFEDSDYIFHLAGTVKSRDEAGYFKGNVELTRTVLEAAKAYCTDLKKMVVTSSLAAGGPTQPGHPIDESKPANPITQYGRSKVAQEALVNEYTAHFPTTIIRPPVVYGPRDTEVLLLFQTLKRGLFSTIGFTEKQVSLVYIDDLIDGMYRAALSPVANGQTYYIADSKFYTWKEMGSYASAAMGVRPFRVKVPHFVLFGVAHIAQLVARLQNRVALLDLEKARDMTQAAWVCSSEKAKQDFGYEAKTNFEKGTKITAAWYKKHGWV